MLDIARFAVAEEFRAKIPASGTDYPYPRCAFLPLPRRTKVSGAFAPESNLNTVSFMVFKTYRVFLQGVENTANVCHRTGMPYEESPESAAQKMRNTTNS